MKRQILLLFIFIANFSNAQKISFNTAYFYEYTYHNDSTDVNKFNTETTVLLSNQKESFFCSYVKMKNDSILLSNVKKGNMVDFSTLPKSRVNQKVYSDKSQNTILIYDKVVNATFAYPENPVKWSLGNSRKKIGDFECQNAYCIINNRKFEAWFTISIPVNDGPYRFKGLPGLVVEVYDEKKLFHFVLSEIKKEEISTELPKNKISTTSADFKNKRREFFNNPAEVSKVYLGDRVKFDSKTVNSNFKNFNVFLD